jgi:hypothetical protein
LLVDKDMRYRPEFMKSFHFVFRLILAGLLLLAVGKASAQAQFADEFDGSSLDPSWTFWDGYAFQFPADTSNHANSGLTGSQLRISIPAGADHNMWFVRQAQVTRVSTATAFTKSKWIRRSTGRSSSAWCSRVRPEPS